MRTLIAATLFAAALGCNAVNSDFVCQTDSDCTQDTGTLGQCEADMRCAYADGACVSGFRYGDLAGDESNACTGDGGGSGVGSGSGGSGSGGSGGGATSCAVAEVRAGATDTCVRRSDGSVRCFGDGATGATDPGLPAGTITKLDVNSGGLCAVYSDGSLDCTKGAATGKIIGSNASDVAIGTDHACAVVGSTIDCWGDNADGQIGGNASSSATPQQVSIVISNAVSVAAGLHTTYEVETNNELWCWGDNSRNQLQQTIVVPTTSNSPMEIFVTAAQVVGGDLFGCALSTSGKVTCWGDETKGQTGAGVAGNDSQTQVAVAGLPASIAKITAGGSHACALDSTGGAWCWGGNASHESAASSAAIVPATQVVDGNAQPLKFLDLDAGAQHTCGRLAPDGIVVCWGGNSDGQLGDGTTTTAIVPTASTVGCP